MNTSIHKQLQTIGKQARLAYEVMAEATSMQKNIVLLEMSSLLHKKSPHILAENAKDIAFAKSKNLSAPMIDRLMLDEKRIQAMAEGLITVAAQSDPVNQKLAEWQRPNGLVLQRITIPIGVIGMIYESRPNVTADAAALSIKSGNAIILRCGSESLHTSTAIVECVHAALKKAGLPEHAVQIVPTRSREAVSEMLSMVGMIDVIIPRGGKTLTQRVSEESKVPTLLHLDGNNHTYIHEKASFAMAKDVLLNAKMRRVSVCGATETLLLDSSIAESILPFLADALAAAGCEMRGDEASRAIDNRIIPASDTDWDTEYEAAIIAIKLVKDADEAIAHINHHSSHHTDAIITEDDATAAKFLRKVDSAIVLHNASTQFADGGEFGFGGEIGIATGRLHARGPVGAEQLTTFKYVVHGTGQTRPV